MSILVEILRYYNWHSLPPPTTNDYFPFSLSSSISVLNYSHPSTPSLGPDRSSYFHAPPSTNLEALESEYRTSMLLLPDTECCQDLDDPVLNRHLQAMKIRLLDFD